MASCENGLINLITSGCFCFLLENMGTCWHCFKALSHQILSRNISPNVGLLNSLLNTCIYTFINKQIIPVC